MAEIGNRSETPGTILSLVSTCRHVIVSNLERYPPEALGILDEDEWNSLVQLRHKKTRPRHGKGGLDGSGRMNPAIGDKYMLAVESALPHLSQSKLTDRLIWKDIVEHRFKVGGLSRPKGLLYPWPVLVETTNSYRENLLRLARASELNEDERQLGLRTIEETCRLPVDLTLLRTTGIGKAVKKTLKAISSSQCLVEFRKPIYGHGGAASPFAKLEATLQEWMSIASSCGIEISGSRKQISPDHSDCAMQLDISRKCKSWRELYDVLYEYDKNRKSNQGARMRERRERLNAVRPRIVKVRHTMSKRSVHYEQRPLKANPTVKMEQIRREASVTIARRRQNARTSGAKTIRGGFGVAVAFASCQPTEKRKKSGPSASLVRLNRNKLMKIPNSKKASTNLKRLAER